MSESKFAFGRNEVGSCVCPAMAAGFEPGDGDGSLYVAEEYDKEVRNIADESYRGIVDEATAKKAWLNTVEYFKRTDMEEAEIGREIAEELGWA